MSTIQKKAKIAIEFLMSIKNNFKVMEKAIGIPDWVRKMFYDALGEYEEMDMIRFGMVMHALERLASAESIEAIEEEETRIKAKMDENELLEWLASSPIRRESYFMDAAVELKDSFSGFYEMLNYAASIEQGEVFSAVLYSLELGCEQKTRKYWEEPYDPERVNIWKIE